MGESENFHEFLSGRTLVVFQCIAKWLTFSFLRALRVLRGLIVVIGGFCDSCVSHQAGLIMSVAAKVPLKGFMARK